jgi:photosystem II stability/assembly factor-like uncharacterized protein
MALSASAADSFIIAVNNNSDADLKALQEYSGRAWGKTADKIYLSGGEEEVDWLGNHNIEFELIEYDDDRSLLYVWYDVPQERWPGDMDILDRGEGYILMARPPSGMVEYRQLKLRKLPFIQRESRGNLLLEYDPAVDALIGAVSQDTVIDFLSRLTGASPIEINGGLDTIHTRYSGTPDNELAAQFLKETLEGYGYEAEYHGFYGGSIRHIAAYDENLAWLVTETSEALKTTDGGQSWNTMPDNTNSALWGIANVGPDLIWLAGDNGTIRFSSDGGESFQSQSSGVYTWLFGVNFVNSSEGWIAGDDGTILHTADGGLEWTTQSTPTGSRLYDVCFVDESYGWACGREGTILNTTDGGVTWENQNSQSNQRLYGIDFTDQDNGWAVGWNGVVRHTTDGGANWQTVNLGSSVEKYHVDFSDDMHGCIAGFDGEIFITTDGGANWDQQSSGTAKDFHGVVFADNLTGFASGNSVLQKTTDGGFTWFSQTENIESAWLNILATKIGTVDPDQQVVICAHMDNRSEQPETNAPGADDNGSGSTATIEAARIFADFNFEKTIKFCLWTGEEQGLLGSAAYAEEAFARGDDIVGVYNFDMIAWDGNSDNAIDLHCGTSNPSIELGNTLVDVITDYNLELDPQVITSGSSGASDHASFWDYGYPAIMGIEDFGDFNPYYHTTGDNMDHIMDGYFTEFTRAAIGAVATLANPDTVMTFVDEGESLPFGFTLHANYPNPFNASTTISFSVAKDTEVDLAIYDVLGRRVATPYNGPVDAGTHRVNVNAGDLSSGVYFYRLAADGNDAVNRMTLLK